MRTVTLRSHITVKNWMNVPITIYLPRDSKGAPATELESVPPNKSASLPLGVVAGRRINVKPTASETLKPVEVSWDSAFEMRSFQSKLVVRCMPKPTAPDDVKPFCINVDFTEEKLINKTGEMLLLSRL